MYGLEVLGKKFKTTMPMEFCIKIANCKHLKKAISKINRTIKLCNRNFWKWCSFYNLPQTVLLSTNLRIIKKGALFLELQFFEIILKRKKS